MAGDNGLAVLDKRGTGGGVGEQAGGFSFQGGFIGNLDKTLRTHELADEEIEVLHVGTDDDSASCGDGFRWILTAFGEQAFANKNHLGAGVPVA